jgi:hypothetical protein
MLYSGQICRYSSEIYSFHGKCLIPLDIRSIHDKYVVIPLKYTLYSQEICRYTPRYTLYLRQICHYTSRYTLITTNMLLFL